MKQTGTDRFLRFADARESDLDRMFWHCCRLYVFCKRGLRGDDPKEIARVGSEGHDVRARPETNTACRRSSHVFDNLEDID
jgi:hypothetical protein